MSPAYDTNAELTNIVAADLIFDFLSVMTLGQTEKVDETDRYLADRKKEEL